MTEQPKPQPAKCKVCGNRQFYTLRRQYTDGTWHAWAMCCTCWPRTHGPKESEMATA